MDGDTRQLVEVLVALSPYALFVAMIFWAAVAEIVEARHERRPPAKPLDEMARRDH
jgi:hypothetical protein